MTTADDILNQIDTAINDWTTSPDAMRSTPADTPAAAVARTPLPDGARELLVRRLVDHHGLTRMTARETVRAVEQGRDSRYAHLVHAEANAILTEAMERIRASFQPIAEAMANAFRRIAEAVKTMQQAQYELAPPQPGRRPDRPAWQSPYGPAQRR